ncbi:hypothetical protein FOFC_21027 [Fusarium oxysporum]|nr:hypothetical protein FOFC_21027 [Fusarium oxysporum]
MIPGHGSLVCVDSTQGWPLQMRPMLVRLFFNPEPLLAASLRAIYARIRLPRSRKLSYLISIAATSCSHCYT